MNVNYINAVCRATKSIMSNYLAIDLSQNKPTAEQDVIPSNDVSVVLGINGELTGQIICSINVETAKSIVGTMMGGMTINELDEMSWSAIQEFGNWIGGTTATEISKENLTIDVTPPVVNEGSSNFRSSKPFVTVPMESSIGLIEVHISLSEENKIKESVSK